MEIKKRTTKEIYRNNLERDAPTQMQELIVALHNVRSMHNVGATFRNADAFGIKKVLLSGFTPVPPRAEITKTAIGAEKYVDWEQSEGFEEALTKLKERDYLIIGIEQTNDSVLLTDYQPPGDQNICLVFGNEVTGLDEEILPMLDLFLEVPQYGHKHSLNVSVTVGVVLYGFLQKYWN